MDFQYASVEAFATFCYSIVNLREKIDPDFLLYWGLGGVKKLRACITME